MRGIERHWGRVVGVLAVLGLVLAAGCGPVDDSDQAAPEEIEPRPGAVVDVQTNPGTADDDYVGARADVGDLTCEQENGRWVGAGTVTNSSDETANYRIYVSLLDGDGDTRGLVEVNVDGLEPGQSEQWSGGLDVTGTDLECVLRVERTSTG